MIGKPALVVLCVMVLIAMTLIPEISHRRRNHRTAHATNDLQVENSRTCEYKADTGYTCPLVATMNGSETVRPFRECAHEVQQDASRALRGEWGGEYSAEYIGKRWEGTDVLYVMTGRDGAFVACVAVDRQQFVPVMSHLYVTPGQRNRGHAKKLLDVVDRYVKVLGFDEVKLWCDPKLRTFYERLGWTLESTKDDHGEPALVMHKMLG